MDSELEVQKTIDSLCNQFEERWVPDIPPDFEDCLNRIQQNHRSQLLHALLQVDLELRIKAGQQIQANDYNQLGEEAVAFVNQILQEQDNAETLDPTRDQGTLPPASPSKQIGPYKLLQQIGEGGMGTVWMAEQEKPIRRRVAIKLIKAGVDNKQVVARFEAERQALAMMDHQNIARVIDAGSTDDGQPYFVMELVQGIHFTKYCDQNRLSINERLKLFIPVCKAIQHAHQKGIIHRDIKPSNVLVSLYDGKPVPKVIDFGLAKALQHQSLLTDKTMFTEFGQVVGTLQYMSPEQAEMNQLDIDTRTDVYSLGVMLYELLTGSTPIHQDSLKNIAILKILEAIREKDPPRPSARLSSSTNEAITGVSGQRRIAPNKLKNILRGELDWVVMKALEKDRVRRYETANGLAADMQRYLQGDPVVARPPSRGYLLRKYVLKNRGLVASLAAIAALMTLGIIGTSFGMYQARTNAGRAEAREEQAIAAVKRFRDAVVENLELQKNPALKDLRRKLLTEPLAFFRTLRDQLHAESDTRPKALEELAQASYELGMLSNEIGDKQAALAAHREALAILDKLANGDANSSQVQSNLAGAHYRIALLLNETGKATDALASLEQMRTIQEQLVRDHPADPKYQANLSSTLNSIGIFHFESGNLAEALTIYRRAQATREKLVLGNPDVPDFLKDLALGHNNIGNVLRITSKHSDAIVEFRKAIEILERLAQKNPESLEYRRVLGISNYNLGIAHRETDAPQDSLKAYARARDIFEGLVRENPSVTDFQSNLAQVVNSVGNLQRESGDRGKALAAYEQALELRERLARENPTVPTFQRALAVGRVNIGNILSEENKSAEALISYQQALEILKKLTKENPTVIQFLNDEATCLNGMGALLRTMGVSAKALTALEQARSIREQMVSQSPNVMEYQFGLNQTLANMALAESDEGQFQKAHELLQDAIERQKNLLTTSPENTAFRELLADMIRDLATVESKLGNDQPAESIK